MPGTQPTFGRRGGAPSALTTATPSTAQPARLADIVPARSAADESRRLVPRSLRATLLAGLVVGLVQAGIAAQAPPVPDLLADALGGASPASAVLPFALTSGIASGVLDAFGALALVRGLLNKLGRTGPLDYALGGGALALASALAGHLLGLGGLGQDLPLDMALGAVAGFLYRLFAGTRPCPAA
jgi:hypothetical protein